MNTEIWQQTTDDYRVVRISDQWQPEMLYQPGMKEEKAWFPLLADGCWAEPDAYSTGNVTKQSLMSEDEARRAIWLSMKINRSQA